jgi:hypothetical protein
MSDRWIKRYRMASFALLLEASVVQTQLQVREAEEPPGKSAQEVLVQDARDLARTVKGDEERKKDLGVLEEQLEGTEKAAETLAERSEDKIRESAEEAGRKADAVQAAAAIEELTVKLDNVTTEQTREAEQEVAALEKEFKDEQDELVGKLHKMQDKYFENHPDLDQDQRTDAEQTFKTIEDEAIETLRVQQDSRSVELQTQQQDLRDNYEQARKELDGTRDQRT